MYFYWARSKRFDFFPLFLNKAFGINCQGSKLPLLQMYAPYSDELAAAKIMQHKFNSRNECLLLSNMGNALFV